MILRRIDVILFIGIKAKLRKDICKRSIFFAKRVSTRLGSKENVIFRNIQQAEGFFLQKDYSKNQSHGIQSAENIFFSLKGKKRPWYLCFVLQNK